MCCLENKDSYCVRVDIATETVLSLATVVFFYVTTTTTTTTTATAAAAAAA